MGASASVKYHYSECCFTYSVMLKLGSADLLLKVLSRTDSRGRLSQVGSLAGAAHLLNGNAGVLR